MNFDDFQPEPVQILPHQAKFAFDRHRYVALVGGFGCGKSFGLGFKLYFLADINRGWDGMLISRTGEQLGKLMTEVQTVLKLMQLQLFVGEIKTFLAQGLPNTYTLYGNRLIVFSWGAGVFTRVYLGTTENYAYRKWAGGNMAFVLIDEIDTMPHADDVWRFANDRVRVKAPLLQTACASTPEGYSFMWDFFENQVQKHPEFASDRAIVRGCTFDNPHLDTSYVRSQMRTRDPASLAAYVSGQFVNLDGALVYYRYNKNLNNTNLTLHDFSAQSIAHVGVDFNKGINAATVSFVQNGYTYTVYELTGAKNVDVLIADLRRLLHNRPIAIYPDGSGFEGIAQLERAFGEHAVHYHAANPLIDRRVAAVNRRLASDTGLPSAFVNHDTCPTLAAGLMRQTKDAKGQPDKTKGLDHHLDGYGYFTHWHWPIDPADGQVRVVSGHERPKYNSSLAHMGLR